MKNEMLEAKEKFEEIIEKIKRDFEQVLIAHAEILVIDIHDDRVDEKIQNLESEMKKFYTSIDTRAELSFYQASYEYHKKQG